MAWYNDKNKIKDIFDAIRNYLICGVVLYFGVTSVFRKSEIELVKNIFIFQGSIFIAISVILFFINTINVNMNIFNTRPKSILDTLVIPLSFGLFLMLGFSLFTSEALKAEMNGKPLSEARFTASESNCSPNPK